MLLPATAPICTADLQAATGLVDDLLCFIASAPFGDYIDTDELLYRLTESCKPVSSFPAQGAFVSCVRKLLALSAQQRQDIHIAFRHDISFHEHISSASFTFAYPSLPEVSRTAAKELMEFLYEKVFGGKRGFTGLDGQSTDPLDRKSLEYAYYVANETLGMTDVCPACLGKLELRRPGGIDRPSASDCEHYFPRHFYPFLMFHPANLTFICPACNRVHGAKDPMHEKSRGDVERGGLRRCFLPYVRTGLGRDPRSDRVRLVFSPSTPGHHVELASVDPSPDSLTQARNFDRVYNLKARWSDHLPVVHHMVSTERRNRRRRAEVGSDVELVSDILDHIVEQRALRLCRADAFLESEYADWLRQPPNLGNLVDSLSA